MFIRLTVIAEVPDDADAIGMKEHAAEVLEQAGIRLIRFEAVEVRQTRLDEMISGVKKNLEGIRRA